MVPGLSHQRPLEVKLSVARLLPLPVPLPVPLPLPLPLPLPPAPPAAATDLIALFAAMNCIGATVSVWKSVKADKAGGGGSKEDASGAKKRANKRSTGLSVRPMALALAFAITDYKLCAAQRTPHECAPFSLSVLRAWRATDNALASLTDRHARGQFFPTPVGTPGGKPLRLTARVKIARARPDRFWPADPFFRDTLVITTTGLPPPRSHHPTATHVLRIDHSHSESTHPSHTTERGSDTSCFGDQ